MTSGFHTVDPIWRVVYVFLRESIPRRVYVVRRRTLGPTSFDVQNLPKGRFAYRTELLAVFCHALINELID